MSDKAPGTWEHLGEELGYEPVLPNDPHQANYMIVCEMFTERFGKKIGDSNEVYLAAERAMVIGLEAWQAESGTKG